MRIGTVSFEIRSVPGEKVMALPSSERQALIARIVHLWSPDLIVCAGYSLDADENLTELAKSEEILHGKTALVVEVKHSASGEPGNNLDSPHQVFFVAPNNTVRPLGRQVFAQRSQLEGHERDARIGRFAELLDEKVVEFKSLKLFSLCCGEINLLKGRNNVECDFLAEEKALLDADIIVNPTHDRMGNAGTLIAKRRWLSKSINKRKRVYISSSNWNSSIGQKPGSDTLHTVYFCGEAVHMETKADLKANYMYRECEVPL